MLWLGLWDASPFQYSEEGDIAKDHLSSSCKMIPCDVQQDIWHVRTIYSDRTHREELADLALLLVSSEHRFVESLPSE